MSIHADGHFDPHDSRVRRRSWLFVAPAILGLLLMLAFVSWKQGLLTRTDRLFFMTGSAFGITRGMPVKLNGFMVGQVDAIELLPPSTQSDQRVRVRLGVFDHYMGYIPRTTRIRLVQEGLIGQGVLELVPQRYDARAIRGGEVLQFERSRGMSEIAQDLEQRVLPVLDHSRELTRGLADPQGRLQTLLATGNEAAVGMVETNARLQATIDQGRRTLAALEHGVAAPLERTDRVLAGMERDLPVLVGTLQAAGENARAATDNAGQLTARAAEQLPRIFDHAERAAADGAALVEDARGVWPLSRVRSRRDPVAPLDSQEGLPLETGGGE